jgi:hypothetical protein
MGKQNDNSYGKKGAIQALPPVWSASQINHLGNVTCYGHWNVNQPAADLVLAMDPDSKNPALRVYTSFGKCMFCEKGAGQ